MSQFSTGRAPEPISAPVLGPAVPRHASPPRASESETGLPAPFYRGQQRAPGASAAGEPGPAAAAQPAPEPQALEAPRPADELPWMSPDDEAHDAPVALESAPGWEGAALDSSDGPAGQEAPAFDGAGFPALETEVGETPIVPIEELAPVVGIEDLAPVVAIDELAPDGLPAEADAGSEAVDYEIYQSPNAAQMVQPDDAGEPLDAAEPWESALLAGPFDAAEQDAVEPPVDEQAAEEPLGQEPASEALPAWEPAGHEEPAVEQEPAIAGYDEELPSWEQPSREQPGEGEPEATSDWETPLPEYVEAEVVEDDAAHAEAPAEETPEAGAHAVAEEQEPREPAPSDAPSAMVAAAAAGAPAPTTALAEIAERLEHIARALREKSPADLIGGPDPLQALIAGYALGYTDAARRRQQDPSEE